jgi:hypothetical protein
MECMIEAGMYTLNIEVEEPVFYGRRPVITSFD